MAGPHRGIEDRQIRHAVVEATEVLPVASRKPVCFEVRVNLINQRIDRLFDDVRHHVVGRVVRARGLALALIVDDVQPAAVDRLDRLCDRDFVASLPHLPAILGDCGHALLRRNPELVFEQPFVDRAKVPRIEVRVVRWDVLTLVVLRGRQPEDHFRDRRIRDLVLSEEFVVVVIE